MKPATLMARLFESQGHNPERRGDGLTLAIGCRWCDHFITVGCMSMVDVEESAQFFADLIGRCEGELYRPIPGTPWFEYGPTK